MYIIKLISLNLYKISIRFLCLFLESELVSGFMTEHAAVVFVFFFLAEYGSIVLMCILISLFFLGGYLSINWIIFFIASLIDYIHSVFFFTSWHNHLVNCYGSVQGDEITAYLLHNPSRFFIPILTDNKELFLYNTGPAIYSLILFLNEDPFWVQELFWGLIIGFKSGLMIFSFIWCRASFPRIRFDNLMLLCWTALLPILFGAIILVPCILYSFDLSAVTVGSLMVGLAVTVRDKSNIKTRAL